METFLMHDSRRKRPEPTLDDLRCICLAWECWRVPFNGFTFLVLNLHLGLRPWFSAGGQMFILFLALHLYVDLGCLAEVYSRTFLGWRWGAIRHVVVVGQAAMLILLATATL